MSLIVAVRCVRKSVRVTGRAPGGAVGVAPPPGRGGADLSQCQPSGGAPPPLRANKPRLGRHHAAVDLLRHGQEVDRNSFLGVRGPDLSGHVLGQGNGDAFQNVLELVQKGRLHGLRIQHSPRQPQRLSEAFSFLSLRGPVRSRYETDSYGVLTASGGNAGLPLEDAKPFRY